MRQQLCMPETHQNVTGRLLEGPKYMLPSHGRIEVWIQLNHGVSLPPDMVQRTNLPDHPLPYNGCVMAGSSAFRVVGRSVECMAPHTW